MVETCLSNVKWIVLDPFWEALSVVCRSGKTGRWIQIEKREWYGVGLNQTPKIRASGKELNRGLFGFDAPVISIQMAGYSDLIITGKQIFNFFALAQYLVHFSQFFWNIDRLRAFGDTDATIRANRGVTVVFIAIQFLWRRGQFFITAFD